jgi:eukaryotic translation initiation factor 2C
MAHSFGDIKTGVATQCLKSQKVRNAKAQYFANVLLKYVNSHIYVSRKFKRAFSRVNVKLGGINTVPDAKSAAILTDPANPTVVMGSWLTSHIM